MKSNLFQRAIGAVFALFAFLGAVVCLLPLTGWSETALYYRLLSALVPSLAALGFAYVMYALWMRTLTLPAVFSAVLCLLPPLCALFYGYVNHYSAPLLCATLSLSFYLTLVLHWRSGKETKRQKGSAIAALILLAAAILLNGFVYIRALIDAESLITAMLCTVLALPNWVLFTLSAALLRERLLWLPLYASPLFCLTAASGQVEIGMAFLLSSAFVFLPTAVWMFRLLREKGKKTR